MDARKISLGDLELFLEASKIGSLRELARSRDMEVSQVSRTIQRLEQRIGHQLFERSPRGLALTPEGHRMRLFAESGLKELGLFESDRLVENNKLPDLEGVAGPSFLMSPLILPLVGKLKSQNVIHRSTVVELPPDRLVLGGLRGFISVAFHAGKLQWPRSWETHPVGKVRWSLYGAKNFFKKSKLPENEVLEKPFVYPIYWSPEGLRDTEDHCPALLRYRKRGVGVSSAWMALRTIQSFPSLTYAPDCLVSEDHSHHLTRIEVNEWPEVKHDVFCSVHVDRITKKLQKKILSETPKIFSAKIK